MSLLLDALKKAADDKKKGTTDVADDSLQIEDSTVDKPLTDESLELELDIETTAEAESARDEFPEVDESAIISTNHQSAETSIEDTGVDFSEQNINTAQEPDEEIADQALETANDSVTETEQSTIDTTAKKIEAANTTDNTGTHENDVDEQVEPTIEPVIEKTPTNQASNISSKIESEQALSALINKSNQHSSKEQLKRTISLAILVTLILIGSGLYFFIEMQTTSQQVYTGQTTTTPIIRQVEKPVEPPPAQAVAENKSGVVEKTQTTSIINKQAARVKPAVPTAKQGNTTAAVSNQKKILNIVRTKKADPVHELLREAYDAFHRNDFKTAESLYMQVLQRESKNRDALLGIAAIATKQQRYEYARQKYQYLLKLNPRDSIATAGISSIENRIDPQLNESQLKFMLKEQPDSPHLYFALGSLYSSQNKWPAAQSAYFSAWSADNKNADYAYNLAVSLDHLGKKDQALDFYQLSLKLKQASAGNFSTASTQQRIRTLKESNK